MNLGTEATDLLKTKDGAPGPNPIRTHFLEKGHKPESVRDAIRYTTREGYVTCPFSFEAHQQTKPWENRAENSGCFPTGL